VLTIGLIGAAFSTTASGFLAQHAGFASAYSAIAAAGLLGAAAVWLLLPETAHEALRED
jgi:predicted MFS family arabinose efflux permease